MTGKRNRTILVGGLSTLAIILALGVGSYGGQTPTAKPAEPAKPMDRPADRDAIKAMMGQFKEAFQKGDASAAAAFMTSEAEIIPDEGDTLKGRDAIQKAYAANFAKTSRPKISVEIESLRFTSRDTALLDGHMTVTREGESPETHRFHMLFVREDGKWLISIIKEWPEESTDLDDLDWLIGTWSAKSGDTEVNNSYEWFGNKSFIKATISVRTKEKTLTALQIIGLDPATGDIRTWTFEHDGGIGEGTITRDSHRWIFENVATLTGGALLESTNILVPVGHDTITWQPINMTINGDSIGNLPPSKLTRVKK